MLRLDGFLGQESYRESVASLHDSSRLWLHSFRLAPPRHVISFPAVAFRPEKYDAESDWLIRGLRVHRWKSGGSTSLTGKLLSHDMRDELVCAPWLRRQDALGAWRHFRTSAGGTGLAGLQ